MDDLSNLFNNNFQSGDQVVNDECEKKIMHRDLERQRRQDMAALVSSLRNLLPLQYVKGKRAASDHMSEAVNYINDLQQRIKEKSLKRDELKRELDPNSSHTDTRLSNLDPNCVKVQQCLGGIQVVVQDLSLSSVLHVLYKQGYSVVSCISTRVSERLINTIQVEVNVSDLASLDLVGLQWKLLESFTSI